MAHLVYILDRTKLHPHVTFNLFDDNTKMLKAFKKRHISKQKCCNFISEIFIDKLQSIRMFEASYWERLFHFRKQRLVLHCIKGRETRFVVFVGQIKQLFRLTLPPISEMKSWESTQEQVYAAFLAPPIGSLPSEL